jgi:hypothetical protein
MIPEFIIILENISRLQKLSRWNRAVYCGICEKIRGFLSFILESDFVVVASTQHILLHPDLETVCLIVTHINVRFASVKIFYYNQNITLTH